MFTYGGCCSLSPVRTLASCVAALLKCLKADTLRGLGRNMGTHGMRSEDCCGGSGGKRLNYLLWLGRAGRRQSGAAEWLQRDAPPASWSCWQPPRPMETEFCPGQSPPTGLGFGSRPSPAARKKRGEKKKQLPHFLAHSWVCEPAALQQLVSVCVCVCVVTRLLSTRLTV